MSCKSINFSYRLLASTALFLAISNYAAAQNTTAAPNTPPVVTADNSQLQEVVVTARKKAENLQNVPLSITALTAQQLSDASATSLQDIVTLTPSLTYNSNGAEANASPVIRGLSDTSGGEATSSNVSIFLDGIYIANPSAIDLSLGGLERVEVVEGPVSALYGRNAFTGAINYVTAKPTDEYHGNAALTIGDSGRQILEVGGSGAIVPGILSGRIGATYDNLDGTFRDNTSGQYGNGHTKNDVLGSLKFTPNDNITISPVFYYGYDEFTAPVSVTYAQNCAIGSSNSYCGNLDTNQIGPFIAKPDESSATGLTRRVIHLHIDNQFRYSWGSVDLLAGYNAIHTESINSFDGTEYGIPYALYRPGANNPFAGNPALGSALAKNFFGDQATEHDTSVELRYESPQQYPIRVAAGGYYYYRRATNNNTFGIDGENIPAGDVLNFISQRYLTVAGQSAGVINFSKTGTLDYSGFGSAEYDILPNLTISTALRWTREEQKLTNGVEPYFVHDFYSITSNNTLTWKPTPDYTLYISAANGEKSGGFNGGATSAADATFDPETDWDYEAGAKTTLLDHHLLLNGAYFHTVLQNLQVLGPPSTAGAIALVVKNFGQVTDDGAELTANYVVGNGLTLGGGVTYTNPRFDAGSYDFNDGAACAAIPSCAATRLVTVKGQKAINLQGLAPPYESDWVFNLSAGYKHSLDMNPFNVSWMNDAVWFVRGDYRYESQVYNTVANFAEYGPRNIVDLHLGLQNENWTLTFQALNLTNDLTPVTQQFNGTLNGFDAPPVGVFGVNWIPTSVLPEGRTFAVKLEYHF